jgi:hypothetical protein
MTLVPNYVCDIKSFKLIINHVKKTTWDYRQNW